MYAIIEVGGKQYSVKEGEKIKVEKQEGQIGKEITLKKVLLASADDKTQVGQPYLKNASVKALVIGSPKGPKTIAYKYRRRKSSDWKKGHRQKLTELEIKEIKVA
ncbi:MAG: 50S ribosomal protein L21 [Candidatus Omnitrophica bacterium]|nr:50S ribosomal protein L21 [Candidatus Omnitrophota bacterium]